MTSNFSGWTEKQWADLLVDNVSCSTQVRELPNTEDWLRCAEALFKLAIRTAKEDALAKDECWNSCEGCGSIYPHGFYKNEHDNCCTGACGDNAHTDTQHLAYDYCGGWECDGTGPIHKDKR